MGGFALTEVQSLYGGAVVESGLRSTVILGPFDLTAWPTKTVCLYNMGATTLSGATVQVNPDPFAPKQNWRNVAGGGPAQIPPNPGLWISYDSTTFQSLGSSEVRGTTLPGLYRWWRVVGTVDNAGLPRTTVSGFIYAGSMV